MEIRRNAEITPSVHIEVIHLPYLSSLPCGGSGLHGTITEHDWLRHEMSEAVVSTFSHLFNPILHATRDDEFSIFATSYSSRQSVIGYGLSELSPRPNVGGSADISVGVVDWGEE